MFGGILLCNLVMSGEIPVYASGREALYVFLVVMSWLREDELVVVACKVVVMYEKSFVYCCWTSER